MARAQMCIFNEKVPTDFSTEVFLYHLQLYQVYAKASPEEVHAVLRKYDSSYIILEDSICLSRSDQRCNLPTTMDLTNGHVRLFSFRNSVAISDAFFSGFALLPNELLVSLPGSRYGNEGLID